MGTTKANNTVSAQPKLYLSYFFFELADIDCSTQVKVCLSQLNPTVHPERPTRNLEVSAWAGQSSKQAFRGPTRKAHINRVQTWWARSVPPVPNQPFGLVYSPR